MSRLFISARPVITCVSVRRKVSELIKILRDIQKEGHVVKRLFVVDSFLHVETDKGFFKVIDKGDHYSLSLMNVEVS